METDRDADDGRDGPGTPGPPADAAGSSHAYEYGESPLEAAGDGGLRAADSGPTAERPAVPGAPADEADPAPGGPPASESGPTTAMRGGTAPRAVLRPVPEGFPTPPPRPARPNRRPAPTPETSAGPGPRRGLLIAAIALAAVLVLVVAVGGGILAVRALTSEDPQGGAATPGSEAPAAPAGAGEVQLGEVTVTEVSTEVGVRSVGEGSTAVEPEGEFVIVTIEVANGSEAGVSIRENVTLETADGESIAADADAGRVHVADTEHFGLLGAGDTESFHMVYDVPIGSTPAALRLDLVTIGETGELPLAG